MTLKGCYQIRDGRHDGGAEDLFTERAHDDVLILGAAEGVILTNAGHP